MGFEPGLDPRADKSRFTETATKSSPWTLRRGPTLKVGTPRLVFRGDYAPSLTTNPNFDVSPDGQRFLMIQPGPRETAMPTQITITMNWFEELNRSATES